MGKRATVTFLDKLRSTDETWSTSISAGFDPDLHESGLARVEYGVSTYGRKQIQKAFLRTFTVAKKYKEAEAAEYMMATVCAHRHEFNAHEAIVEGQQIYPRDADNIPKLVAIANDMVYLGWVAGSAFSMFMLEHSDPCMKLPAQWKKQRAKEPMHEHALQLLEDDGADLYCGPLESPTLVKSIDTLSGHALDALCMALVGAGYRV